MTVSLQDMMAHLTPEQRAYIEQRSYEIEKEHLSMQELRKAQSLTQKRMAEMLNIGQENISRLEKRSDLMLSTLTSYIEAMGGHLKLLVEFPGRPPVYLKGFGDLTDSAK